MTQAYLFEGVRLLDPILGVDAIHDIYIDEKKCFIDPKGLQSNVKRVNAKGLWAAPGLTDIQVHFRQPGFEYKETHQSGSKAAFSGGITNVVVMPNTRPTLDTEAAVLEQFKFHPQGVRILVAAAATKGLAGKELTNFSELKKAGAIAITDDGLPVMDDDLMEDALRQCAKEDLLFMQHAEDLTISKHGSMNLSETSKSLGVSAQSADAEGVMVERDIELVKKIENCRYHVLHLSTKRSLNAVKKAKAAGFAISCEASPHHLLLNDRFCQGGDSNFKMNPPLRDENDRLALVEALADGTIDALATDHAPHSREEKAKGFEDAPFGVIGLETAFATLLEFVHKGIITPGRAVELMTKGPARVLRNDSLGSVSRINDLILIDPKREWIVDENTLQSKSKNSAFLGKRFKGKVVATFKGGICAYQEMSSL